MAGVAELLLVPEVLVEVEPVAFSVEVEVGARPGLFKTVMMSAVKSTFSRENIRSGTPFKLMPDLSKTRSRFWALTANRWPRKSTGGSIRANTVFLPAAALLETAG